MNEWWMRLVREVTGAVACFLLVGVLGLSPAPAVGAEAPPPASFTTRVRDGGTYMLVRYRTDGTVLQRLIGFSTVADVAVYDAQTLIVAERQDDRLSAVTVDGRILWTVAVRRPRCVQVLDADRLLVCQDGPAGVAEINRSGAVLWEVTAPLTDAAGAVRLPDGNTAVVEGREGHHAVHVLDRSGRIVWTGTKHLAQPRGLALLPSGEIVTSGFDTGFLVFFKPYTADVRSIGFCCHPEWAARTLDGGLLSVTAEQQMVRGWRPDGSTAWEFKTAYPVYRAEMLPDGSVVAAEYQVPDRQCLNAHREADRRARPLAPYWIWLAVGSGSGLLLLLIVQGPVLRRAWVGRHDAGAPVAPVAVAAITPLSIRRRCEIGLYTLLAAGGIAAAVLLHLQRQSISLFESVPYAAIIVVAGLFLAALQAQLPAADDGWNRRMADLRPMASPSWRAWLCWGLGVGLLGAASEGLLHKRGEWIDGLWAAGLVAMVAGGLEVPPRRERYGWGVRLLWVAIGLGLLGVRLFGLEQYPPNLHLDMSQWSVQTLHLLDGDVGTFFTNGWAEIPMAGYTWSALWTALAGRSLAGCRMASVAGSLVAIVAAALLVRRLYGPRAAVMVAIILGTNHAFLHFSRIQAYMDPIPFHVLAVLALLSGLESGRYGWFGLAGVAGGFSALAYHAGRITPPMLALLGLMVVIRYPRVVRRRWPGFLLLAVTLVGTLGPQAVIYETGRAYALGRSEMYPFLTGGHVDIAALVETIRRGVPRVIGAFWVYGDSSTQFGSAWPILPATLSALFGAFVIAALVRLSDIRGLLVVAWCGAVLFVGGVLTIDPPFWPRIVIAFIPACIACAAALDALCRGVAVAGGRPGRVAAFIGACCLLGFVSWQQLDTFRRLCLGIAVGRSEPSLVPEWVHSVMGRDIQRWGQDAMVYIVADNPNWHSCDHATMRYYGYAVDVQDARDINAYLPFKDPRTIVVYFVPQSLDAMAGVRQMYPDAETQEFTNNLGRHIFTRMVIRAPHSG